MKAFGSSLPVALALGVALLAGQAMTPARAALGDTVASVQSDRASMKGQLRTRSGPGYSVQQITAATGTVVREYVSPSGVIFAVSWYGPAMPDLQQTLGPYFAQLQAAIKARQAQHAQRGGHYHLQVREPDFVVHAGGHMRQYFGIAYVPSLVSPNLSLSDLH